MRGFRIRIAMDGDASEPAPDESAFRVVPVSATEAFIVAPHAALGAVAWHFVKGNNGATGQVPDSIGAPYGNWRLYGVRTLPNLSADPVSGYTEIVQAGIGSQEHAILVSQAGGNVWGGIYHGGLQSYTQTAPTMTTAGTLAAATLSHSARIQWAGGEYGDVAGALTVNPDGSLATSCTLAMPFDTLTAYLDMTIVGAGFTRASIDGGATWLDLTAVAVGADTQANADTVIFRNPSTGTTVTVTDDARAKSNFASKAVTRRSTDFKLYVNLNTMPAGSPFGTQTVSRTISLGKTAPDPAVPSLGWSGAANGASGYTLQGTTAAAQITFDSSAKKLVFTRGAGTPGQSVRATFPATGLTIGQSYSFQYTSDISGGSPSGGVQISRSNNADGSSGTLIQNAAAGTQTVTFTATAAIMTITFGQASVSGSDAVFRLSSLGPIA
jgi:hypothetical protein